MQRIHLQPTELRTRAHPTGQRRSPTRRSLLIATLTVALALFASACGSSPGDRDVAGPVLGAAPGESGSLAPPDLATVEPDVVVDEPPTVTALPTATVEVEPTPTPIPVSSEPVNAPSTPVPATPSVAPTPAATPAPPAPTLPPVISQATPPLPSIDVGCTISPRRPVQVREKLVFTATQNPSSPAVDFTFDHGDGTLDRAAISHAYYLATGTYKVNLNWSYGGRTGRLFCGNVDVVSPAPTPNTPPGMSITCAISPKTQVAVGEQVTFTVGQTPGNVAMNYTIDYGDGTGGVGPLSQTNYWAPGTYTVKLSWSGAGRNGTILCGQVKVFAPAVPAVTVQCTITPNREVVVGETLTYRAHHSPTNATVAYAFDHGDGTIDRQPVSTAYYERPGRYNVLLSWTHAGRNGSVFCGTVTVVSPNPVPAPLVEVACTISVKRDVFVGEIVTLTAHQTPANVPVSFSFDHGDGTIDPRSVSTAYYEAPGTYNVMLNWSSGARYGSVFCGAIRVVPKVPEPAVAISCAVSPKRRIQVGESVTLTAQQAPANIAVSYAFDHGDGTIDRQPVSNATYLSPGTYIVKLSWSHANGSGTTACGAITVDPATPPA